MGLTFLFVSFMKINSAKIIFADALYNSSHLLEQVGGEQCYKNKKHNNRLAVILKQSCSFHIR